MDQYHSSQMCGNKMFQLEALHFLLVVLKLGSDFLSIFDQVFQIVLLSNVSLVDFVQELLSDIDPRVLEGLLVLSFGDKNLLVVVGNSHFLNRCQRFSNYLP